MPWKRSDAFLVLDGPIVKAKCFFYNFRDDECFSVFSDDIQTPTEIYENWTLVEAADGEEILSLIHI